MSDQDRLSAIIRAMHPIEAEYAREEKPPTWNDAEVASIYGSAEVDRLLRDVPKTDPEIARLLKIANEETPADDSEVERLANLAAEEAPKTN